LKTTFNRLRKKNKKKLSKKLLKRVIKIGKIQPWSLPALVISSMAFGQTSVEKVKRIKKFQ